MINIASVSLTQPLETIADELGRSFGEYGFAVVRDHGIPQELIDRAEAMSKAFFALPDEAKIDEGINELKKALSQDEQNSVAWRLLAQAYDARKRDGLARYATAEYNYIEGDRRQALIFALRARDLLEPDCGGRGLEQWRRGPGGPHGRQGLAAHRRKGLRQHRACGGAQFGVDIDGGEGFTSSQSSLANTDGTGRAEAALTTSRLRQIDAQIALAQQQIGRKRVTRRGWPGLAQQPGRQLPTVATAAFVEHCDGQVSAQR